ncbi:beta-class carbonic anhydrase [Streptomyces sp. NPDC058953]|uniref:beta-class carbonic anhydrase n=1 Tax=unclassified Streptomyces TaxID=2593676 RepID=UPI0036AF988D
MSDTYEDSEGSVVDEYLANNVTYAAAFGGPLALPPARRLAVVACMDARLDIFAILGLKEGDAHIVRNAGGAVTEDAIRSVAISQRLLGTNRIMLIHHTDCGMQTFKDDEFKADLQAETGIRPPWSPEAFTDLEEDVRQSIRRIEVDPFVPHKHSIRGFVFDVHTGRLKEVSYPK